MKRGIKVEGAYDRHDISVLRISKARGKLTLDEIEDTLRYGNNNMWCGHYAIILNCSEATLDGPGIFDEDEPAGDAVDLYPIEEGEFCPVCGKYTPPFVSCPNCGAEWADTDKTAETHLAAMKEEAAREIGRATSRDAKLAWYWTHIGAIDLARQMGFITDDRRQQLYEEFRQYKPE